jgi:Cu-Zn family superoxide dismutase
MEVSMSPVIFLKGLVALTLAMGVGASISEAKGPHGGHGDGQGPVRASAEIQGCTDLNIVGTAQLTEEKTEEGIKEVKVMMMVKGLADNKKHAVHIHETASCEPCGSAGGHFDPGPAGLTSPNANHPFHSGDLINIEANRRGNAHLNTTTTRVTLSPGPLSLFDGDGSAFIIHILEDTYCPDGNVTDCAGGGRAACGIITLDDN